MQKRITLYSNLFSFDPAFSITRIMAEQVEVLIANGYKPNVIVSEGFVPGEIFCHPDVTLVYIPVVPVSNDGTIPGDWGQHLDKLRNALEGVFSVSDVVITHDIVWRPDLLMYNLAMREAAALHPEILWLNWIHSATSADLLTSDPEVLGKLTGRFPNSYIVYPNSYEVPRISRNFGYEEEFVKWCPHPTDIARFFDFHPKAKEIADKNDLWSADVVIVYPVRLDRGKQPHKVLGVAIACQRLAMKTKLVICDFHSTGGDKVSYRNEMKEYAKEHGFDGLVFTSDDKELELEVPRKVVANLFQLSNVFLLPSMSETYSLIAQEAGLAGNLMILNQDFPPFRSIYGDLPRYYQFDSSINANSGYNGSTTTGYDASDYFAGIAQYISYMLRYDPIIGMKTKLRKNNNPQAIFKKYMEPLFYING